MEIAAPPPAEALDIGARGSTQLDSLEKDSLEGLIESPSRVPFSSKPLEDSQLSKAAGEIRADEPQP
eukprot:12089799-Alexandrium_andersonii.AAC.1